MQYVPVQKSECLDSEDRDRALCYLDSASNSAWQRCGVLAPSVTTKIRPEEGVLESIHELSNGGLCRRTAAFCVAFVSFTLGLLPVRPPSVFFLRFFLRCMTSHHHTVVQ